MENNYYRHYSFDLWMTLIRSNPSFKVARTKYFFTKFNYYKKTLEEISKIFREVDIMCNSINERSGKNIDANEMYLMVISLINNHSIDLQQVDIMSLYDEMEQLLFNYIPEIYCSDTRIVLNSLKNRSGTTLNILSNTGFVKGRTLRKVLKEIDLCNYFDFQIYSDEEGLSKPDKQLFQKVISQVCQLHNSITLKEIVHIGDNPVADIKGANEAGIESLLINSNELSILKLLNRDTYLLPA